MGELLTQLLRQLKIKGIQPIAQQIDENNNLSSIYGNKFLFYVSHIVENKSKLTKQPFTGFLD